MKVFVTGATGVLGSSALRALLADGHHVAGLAHGADRTSVLEAAGVTPFVVDLFDGAALTEAMRGFDAVCNLVTHIPVGLAGMRLGSWRANDRLRTEGSRLVEVAAESAGVRRIVQESTSFLYADGGDTWITETSPLTVTRALEPAAVAEANAMRFTSSTREAVVLRFGNMLGDDAMTKWLLDRARSGRPIGFGDPDNWAHLVHPEDAGAAVAAALHAPAGVYNVGADPIQRREMLSVIGEIVDRPQVGFIPRIVLRMAGERLEPQTRSHRISSVKLHEATGWKPSHPVFDVQWVKTASTR